MKKENIKQIIMILSVIVFVGLLKFASQYRLLLFIAIYACLAFFTIRDVHRLASGKGRHIKLPQMTINHIKHLNYLEAIMFYLSSLILVGLSIYFLWDYGIHKDHIELIAMSAICALMGGMFGMHATHIKQILYLRETYKLQEDDLTSDSTGDRD